MHRIVKIATAGSVDDGKSTLIARLLLDSDSLPQDLKPKDTKPGTLANLLDGLEVERQQGITIDVAHRFFDHGNVRFHLMDSPGHEQYTRNMATAASGADALLLLISANEGIKPQTLNHLRVAMLVGVRRFIVVINKLDLVRNRAATVREARSQIVSAFDFTDASLEFVGVIATTGENVVNPSRRLSFEGSGSLLQALQKLAAASSDSLLNPAGSNNSIVSIQHVIRTDKRRFLAEVFSGSVAEGQVLLLSGTDIKCTVKDLYASGAQAVTAESGSQISFELEEDRDIARGDLLTQERTEKASFFAANLVWLDQTPGYLKRRYFLQIGHQRVSCRISKIKVRDTGFASNASNLTELPANSISLVEIVTTSPVLLDLVDSSPLQRFILIDSESSYTCAAGIVRQIQRRSTNLTQHDFKTNPREVASQLGFEGKVVWLTGLSGSGKSTIANALAGQLAARGTLFSILDGDSLRQGLNRDLGFTDADRVENIRRSAEVSKLLAASGLVVIVALVSPFRSDREDAREIIGPTDFLEIFVDAPLEVCEERDPKGLYKKARAGLIPNFTGIDSSYEPPLRPSLRIDTSRETPLKAAEQILALL